MTTEQKVTSRELSEKLRDAGAKQESENFWAYRPSCGWQLYNHRTGPAPIIGYDSITEIIATFDCAELLEKLPITIESGAAQKSWLRINRDELGYEVYYYDPAFGNVLGAPMIGSDSLAEALGKLYLWLLENGHIKPRKVCETHGVPHCDAVSCIGDCN